MSRLTLPPSARKLCLFWARHVQDSPIGRKHACIVAIRYIEAVANATAAATLVKDEGIKKAGFFYKRDDKTLGIRDPVTGIINYISIQTVQDARFHVAIADVNAGLTLLAALPSRKYQLLDAWAIAVGGAAATGTTVDILGTQSTSVVKLVSFAQASLTQSTLLRPGVSGVTILADGASFAIDDVNTAITIGKTGSNFTGATFIDVMLSYAITT